MEWTTLVLLLFFVAFVVLPLLSASIKVVREYERAVIFRLGRLIGAKGPGLFFIIPIVDKFFKVDLRVTAADIPRQRIITRDNVTVDVDAVVYYRVVDPEKAITAVENYDYACRMLAQTTLRDVIGQVELDDLLSKREELNKRIQRILDAETEPWGVKVVAVTIRDVVLPEEMVRAMAKQAEAERVRRSRIINAEGELQAAKIMLEAAKQYENNPIALRLRELQTLYDIAREQNLIIITPTITSTAGEVAALVSALRRQGQGGSGK